MGHRPALIGLNKIHLGLDRFGFWPRYLVAINRKVVAQTRDVLPAMPCVKFLARPAAVEAGIAEDALTYLVETEQPAPPRFSTDLSRGMHEGWTVTYAALQVAWHLGFSQVILVGLDHRYTYAGRPNEARVLEGADPNHFDPRYFGGGQTWDNPDLARSEESYRIARAQFESAGRSIVDATPGGACPVFERADFHDLLPA